MCESCDMEMRSSLVSYDDNCFNALSPFVLASFVLAGRFETSCVGNLKVKSTSANILGVLRDTLDLSRHWCYTPV